MLHINFTLSRPGFQFEVELVLPSEGITGIHGPSGSGKTTLLRCVAGLERPSGRIRMEGLEPWQDTSRGLWLPTHRRGLGYVFQEASLFEHLSIEENLRYGLRRSAHGQAKALEDAIELLGIGHLLARQPQGLSGGERQRVAIARALATRPKLLLLDEPLASLDRARRLEILPWLERLHHELRLPMLYVTHTMEELARLADTVVLMDGGKAWLSGDISSVLTDPAFARLAGDEAGAVMHGSVCVHDVEHGLSGVMVEGQTLWVRGLERPVGTPVRVHIHANEVSLSRLQPLQTSIQNVIPATLQSISDDPHGAAVIVRLRLGGQVLLSRITRRAATALELKVGDLVWAQIKSVALPGH